MTKRVGWPLADLSYIVEPLRGFAVPIDSLILDAGNPNVHDARSLDALGASLKRFGQRLPLVVQKDNNVVRVGNGRLQAARNLGWTHVAALFVDESDMEAVQYAIADNQTASLSYWDDAALGRVLKTLREDVPDFDITALGWGEDELNAMLAQLGSALGVEEDLLSEDIGKADFKEYNEDTIECKFRCPKCGYEWNGAAR